jgi:ribosomal protein S18 acetylase RimI-like enzyme
MVHVRAATRDDIHAVVSFWEAAAENQHRPTDTADAVASLIDRDPGALLLAVDDRTLIGSVIAGWDGWRCHLYRLAVDPAHRRHGVGRALVDAAEARFRSLGGRRVDAMVLDDNAAAHRTWEALGYRRQQEWSRWVKPLVPA